MSVGAIVTGIRKMNPNTATLLGASSTWLPRGPLTPPVRDDGAMSQANVEVVKNAFDALRREDWVALASTIADDCEVRDYDIPDAAGEVYRGPDGFRDWLAEFDRAWASWRVVDEVYRWAPDGRVIALFRMAARGRESGIELGRDDPIVYVVRDGKIARMEYYNDQQAALQAIGLSE